MATPYLGEIRMFAGSRLIEGWEYCNGQLLSISEYDALYNLLGTTYGGDGQTTFGVPDLRGRIPVHQGTLPGGQTYVIGQKLGVEEVTVLINQMPGHTHSLQASSGTGFVASPGNAFFAGHRDHKVFASTTPNGTTTLNSQAVSSAGGNQPHENMPPFLCVNFIIAVFGIYPSQG
ncbi:phage tail protein [Comamonas sp. J-3]|uniref:phage tail protein n=1 Tax=Comamonas trifloxystrobinivorans TaxID=3350256 RepID=UPI00372BFB34